MENTSQTVVTLNGLKRHIFYELLNLVGRVFVVVRYAEDVIIGKRGFLPEEKEKGIVLVFNKKTGVNWDDYGIDARLVFGTTPEHCIIPAEHVIGVYSPELNTQFLCMPETGTETNTDSTGHKEEPEPSKVVKVDFRKKKT